MKEKKKKGNKGIENGNKKEPVIITATKSLEQHFALKFDIN